MPLSRESTRMATAALVQRNGDIRVRAASIAASEFDDCFGVMAVLEQRVLDGLRAADEQAAIETVLFLGDPVAAAVFADEDDRRCRAARWRFDELHVGVPSMGE